MTINSIIAACNNLTLDSMVYVYSFYGTYQDRVSPELKAVFFELSGPVKNAPVKYFWIDMETWALHVYLPHVQLMK